MDAFLKSLVSKNQLVLIDFFAVWCEPCKWVVPVLENLEKHFGEKIMIVKVDIDLHPEIARSLHILSVPSLVLFKNEEEVWRMRGFDLAPKLINTLEKFVA